MTLHHVKRLEEKVSEAVALIASLRNRIVALEVELSENKSQVSSLQTQIDDKLADQDKIEEGILKALSVLEGLEAPPSLSSSSSEEGDPTPESSSSTSSLKNGDVELF